MYIAKMQIYYPIKMDEITFEIRARAGFIEQYFQWVIETPSLAGTKVHASVKNVKPRWISTEAVYGKASQRKGKHVLLDTLFLIAISCQRLNRFDWFSQLNAVVR